VPAGPRRRLQLPPRALTLPPLGAHLSSIDRCSGAATPIYRR
jgi:hypothetical protein